MLPEYLKEDPLSLQRDDVFKLIKKISKQKEPEINLAEAALLVSKYLNPQLDLSLYLKHLDYICMCLDKEKEKKVDTLEEKAALLSEILHHKLSYDGDIINFDHIENLNLSSVIDRRRGMPISLGILYLFAASHMRWQCEGLRFPGHFLMRLEDKNGERCIIDPFHKGEIRKVEEMRALIKMSLGPEAELLSEFFDPCPDRDIFMRFLNNLKLRFIKLKKNTQSIDVIRIMLLFVPKSARLWRQLGLLQAHNGQLKTAIKSLESFIFFHQEEKEYQQITTEEEFRQVEHILNKLKRGKTPISL